MTHVPHELHEAFPEHAGALHRLRADSAHFARLEAEHHALNRAIHRAETDVEPCADHVLEEMKRRRLALLDEIAALLHGA